MRLRAHLVFLIAMMGASLVLLVLSLNLPPDARSAPVLIAIPVAGLLVWELVQELANPPADRFQSGNMGVFLWLLGFVLACQFLDGVIVVSAFLLLSLRFWARASWLVSFGVAAAAFVALRVAFPNGLAHPPLF